jgi:hypothetical protein
MFLAFLFQGRASYLQLFDFLINFFLGYLVAIVFQLYLAEKQITANVIPRNFQ